MSKKRKYSVTETDVAVKVHKLNSMAPVSAHVKHHKHGKRLNVSSVKVSDTGKLPLRHETNSTTRTIPESQNEHSSQSKKAKVNIRSWHDGENTKGSNMCLSAGGNDIVKRKKTGSCMKHKKQDKVLHLKKRHKKWKKSKDHSKLKHSKETDACCVPDGSKVEKVVFPRHSHDISANWKELQKKFHIKHKKKKKSYEEKSTAERPTGASDPVGTKTEPDIWFDDVDEVLIEASKTKLDQASVSTDKWDSSKNPLVKSDSFTGLTKMIAMDCEMVGTGSDGQDSILARVSVVNQYGQCIYDKLVRATDKITDYRTQFSGIRPGDLDNAEEYRVVQKEVHDMMKGRILVGHAIQNDLKVLFLDHPRKATRDTSKYKPFRKLFQGKTPSLKKLSDQVLGVKVQEGEHNSIQDAQAAMRLYTMYRKTWEKDIKLRGKLRAHKQSATTEQNTDNMATLDSDHSD